MMRRTDSVLRLHLLLELLNVPMSNKTASMIRHNDVYLIDFGSQVLPPYSGGMPSGWILPAEGAGQIRNLTEILKSRPSLSERSGTFKMSANFQHNNQPWRPPC
jgi:hypothetical protein